MTLSKIYLDINMKCKQEQMQSLQTKVGNNIKTEKSWNSGGAFFSIIFLLITVITKVKADCLNVLLSKNSPNHCTCTSVV